MTALRQAIRSTQRQKWVSNGQINYLIFSKSTGCSTFNNSHINVGALAPVLRNLALSSAGFSLPTLHFFSFE
jgi:hypothetical protein